MAAKDYEICPALFSAYFAKVSKRNPNMMTNDRREITEGEILMLIDWWLDRKCDEGEHGKLFKSHLREGFEILVTFKKEKEE